jgi:hypothetical protein
MSEDTSSQYDWDEIVSALADAEKADIIPERGRPRRSLEETRILQRYGEWIRTKLAAEDRIYLDQIREEYQLERLRLSEAEKAAAVERSSEKLTLLLSRVAALREAAEDITSRRSQELDSRSHVRIALERAGRTQRRRQSVISGRGANTIWKPCENGRRLAIQCRPPV